MNSRKWGKHLQLLDIEKLFDALESNATTGLTTAEANRRLIAFGKNKFALPEKDESKLRKYLRNVFYTFGSIVFLCSIFCFVLYFMDDNNITNTEVNREYIIVGKFLMAVLLFYGYLGYLQENDDFALVLAFKELMPMYCTVVRDGRKQIIRAENVVLGDILLISYGERLAADVRVLFCHGLELNYVALTGTSGPIIVSPELSHRDKWMARNVGLACTHVMKGEGLGIVIACGSDTEVGIVARLSMQPRPRTRPRKHSRQITHYTYFVAFVMLNMLLGTMFLTDRPKEALIEFNVAMTLALVPVHLPALVFFGLWRLRNRLHEKGCYVRNMEAVSTLGLTTVICSTLLGTLTMKKWRVSEIFVDGRVMHVEEYSYYDVTKPFMALVRISVLCNDAYERPGQRGVPKVYKEMYGSKFDKAVLMLAINIIPDIKQLRDVYEIMTQKFQSNADDIQVTVHRKQKDDGHTEFILLMKGPFDLVLSHCSSYFVAEKLVPMDEVERQRILDVGSDLRRKGRYVYAYGRKKLTPKDVALISAATESFHINNSVELKEFLNSYDYKLYFAGLIAIYDPPWFNVINSVDRCRSAGIKLILLTETNIHFATALAKTLGIIDPTSETVNDVAERLHISESEVNVNQITAPVIDMHNWHKKVHHQKWDIEQILQAHEDLVFAGIAQLQRHIIVEVCQKLGSVVTVVGCAVDHTSALHCANVGVAESSASEACQWCADIFIRDRNFEILINAIEESRLLFENMKKALAYALSPCTGLIMVHFAYLTLKIPFRLFLITSLVIDLFVNLVPALSLYYERAKIDLMKQKPKIFDDFIINRRLFVVAFLEVGIIQASAIFLSYFACMSYNGFLPAHLVGLANDWYDKSNNDITDSFGQEWSREARLQLEYQVTSVTLLTLVIMQCTNLILIKAGRGLILRQLFDNYHFNLAVIYLICLAIVISFLDSPEYFRITPVRYLLLLKYIWPCVILSILVHCGRRYVLRHFPGSWLERETYFG